MVSMPICNYSPYYCLSLLKKGIGRPYMMEDKAKMFSVETISFHKACKLLIAVYLQTVRRAIESDIGECPPDIIT